MKAMYMSPHWRFGLVSILLLMPSLNAQEPAQKACQMLSPYEMLFDLRNISEPPAPWKWIAKMGDEDIQPGEQGLRIQLKPGRKGRDPVGFELISRIPGDFEVTGKYELLEAKKPSSGGGVGVQMWLQTDTPTKESASLYRVTIVSGEENFGLVRATTIDGKRQYPATAVPTKTKRGRIRLTRNGTAVTYSATDEDETEFKELWSKELGVEDLKTIRFAAHSGDVNKEAVTVRLIELRVRSNQQLTELMKVFPKAANFQELPGSAQPSAPPPVDSRRLGTGLICLIVAIGLLIPLIVTGLIGWKWMKNRQAPPPKESAPKSFASTGSLMSVACTKCGQKVKVKSEHAGKKVKCPKCSEVIVVKDLR